MTPAILALGLNAIFTGLIGLIAIVGIAGKMLEPDEVHDAYILGGAATFLFAISVMAIVA